MEATVITILSVLLAAVSTYAYLAYREKRRAKEATLEFYRENENHDLEHIYTDLKGNKWYTLKDPKKIPKYREIEVQIAMRQLHNRITDVELAGFCEKIREALDEQKFTKAAGYVERLEERISYAVEMTTLLQLAKSFFFLEGENINRPSQKFNDLKDEIFSDDLECRAFFLQGAWKLTDLYASMPVTDILTYLMAVEDRKKKPMIMKRPSTSK